jgi:hypothetical protein
MPAMSRATKDQASMLLAELDGIAEALEKRQ